MNQSRAENVGRNLRWFAISLAFCPSVLFLYLFFEWLFFATKPSMLSGLGWVDQARLLIRSPAPIMAVLAGAQIVAGLIFLMLPWRLRIVALLPSATILGTLILMLLDNFTYVLLGFGIVQTGAILRWLYLIVLIAACLAAAKFLFDTAELVRRSSGRTRALLIGFLLLFVVAAVASVHLPEMGRVAYASELGLTDAGRTAEEAQSSGASTDGRERMDRRPNVLFLSADGLPAERLSIYGYERETSPFLESMKGEWLLFENAFANAGTTHGSLVSMLTGKHPLTTRVIYPPQMLRENDSVEHLPNILKRLGYKTVQLGMRHYADAEDAGAVGAFDYANYRWEKAQLAELADGFGIQSRWSETPELSLFRQAVTERVTSRILHLLGIDRMVDHHAHAVQQRESTFWSDTKRVRTTVSFIRELRPPWFMQVHLLDTHCCSRNPRTDFFKHLGPKDRNARFDGEIRDADDDFRQILSVLEESGLIDETIVVVTSDHTPGWGTTGRIPLMIRFPHADPAGSVAENSQLIDLAPTVLDYVGLPVPSWMEGESLLTDLDPLRPIFGSWRVADRDETAAGLNVLSNMGPPYYGLVSATMIQSDRFFELNVVTGAFSEGRVEHHTNPVAAPIDAVAAKKLLVRELESRGFLVSPVSFVVEGDKANGS